MSAHEVPTPYIEDFTAFWARADLYVMRPDVEPLDRWPDEVLQPDDFGIRVIVLLPGDYRGRSNGSLGDGVLYIEASGTETEPLLVTYAPAVGADIGAAPHPAERLGGSEARLIGIRVWNQRYQSFHGLTFRDGFASSLVRDAEGITIDRCLWHETTGQPLRIRFDTQRCLVQRCVMQRFDASQWAPNDVVAIQLSDGACTHNRFVSNVILNYTDSLQTTDREGEPYGLSAGTLVDNNFMGFTAEAYLQEPNGELLCGENSLDFKMGGTEAEPVRVTNNVFFGTRAAKPGCAASGSGGYAITLQRRGTWIEMTDNLFVDCDSGIFLNAMFLNVDAAQGRIDPEWTFRRNTFSGMRSYSTAFPTRTGRVFSGSSPARFEENRIVACDRLMEREPVPNTGDLVFANNALYGPIVLDPRDETRLRADGNTLDAAAAGVPVVLPLPWVGLSLRYLDAP
ncbi:MAG: hypothetical protein AAGD14_14180 [Planctomycetota bacterium]